MISTIEGQTINKAKSVAYTKGGYCFFSESSKTLCFHFSKGSLIAKPPHLGQEALLVGFWNLRNHLSSIIRHLPHLYSIFSILFLWGFIVICKIVFSEIINGDSGKLNYCTPWNANACWWLSIFDIWKMPIVICAGTDWGSIICAISLFSLPVSNALSLFFFDVSIRTITKRKRPFRFAYAWFYYLHWISRVKIAFRFKG